MKIVQKLQELDKTEARAMVKEELSKRAIDVLNEVQLNEAGMSPKQRMDFNRYMAGALSKKDYNEKWKVGQKSDGKSKLDPTGVYHNLIKTYGDDEKKVTKE